MLNLTPLQLLHIWDQLPVEYRADREVAVRLPCFQHYNRSEHRTHIDGPPPAIINCTECRRDGKRSNSSNGSVNE